MTTLREAAQQALEQPEQEPVATVEIVVPHLESIVIKHIVGAPFPTVGSLVYTALPRREWQSLGKYEPLKLWGARSDGPSNSEIIGFARAIEAALKEKNA